MTNKTRKHIWPGTLVMAIAVVGIMAAFLVLANNPGVILAQGDPCAGMTEAERGAFLLGGGTCGVPDTGNGDTMVGANAPSAPMKVRSEVLDNMILVRWNKPENIGPEGAEISHYVITRMAYTMDANSPINESGGKTMMVGSTVREYRDQGLGYNTTYSHTVKAVNMYTINDVMGSSTGPDSAPVTTTTATSGGLLLPELAPPGAPMAMNARGSCDDQISVTWEAPADAGKVAPDTVGCPVCANQTPAHTGGTGAGIQVKPGTAMVVSYMVERSVDGAAWRVLTTTNTSLRYVDTANLGYGKTYAYRVTAMNNAGLYGDSAMAEETLNEPSLPLRPTSLVAVVKTTDVANSVELQWDPPEDPAGLWRTSSDIGGDNLSESLVYRVQRQVGNGDWMTIKDQAHRYSADGLGTVRTQEYTDVGAPIGIVRYRVAALVDDCNISLWNQADELEVMELPLGNASGLSTVSSAAGTVELTWTPGVSSSVHWVAGIGVNADGSYDYNRTVWTQSAAQNSHTVAGLASGNYLFAVIAGENVNGPWSNWTMPGMVTVQ